MHLEYLVNLGNLENPVHLELLAHPKILTL